MEFIFFPKIGGKDFFLLPNRDVSMNTSKIIDYIKGNASNKTYLISLIANLSFIFLCLIIAMILFQPPFDMTKIEVSTLDSTIHNPVGLYFFEIGFIVGGFWFLPTTISMTRSMRAYSKIFGTMAGIFYICAGIGLIIVGFCPTRNNYPLHIVGAGLGFGGLLLAKTIILLLLALNLKRNFNSKVLKYSLIFYLPFLVVYIITIILYGIPSLGALDKLFTVNNSAPALWALFEWLMLITGLYSTFGTQILFSTIFPEIKKEMDSNNNNEIKPAIE